MVSEGPKSGFRIIMTGKKTIFICKTNLLAFFKHFLKIIIIKPWHHTLATVVSRKFEWYNMKGKLGDNLNATISR